MAANEKLKLVKILSKFNGTLTESPAGAHYAIAEQALEQNLEFFGQTVRPLWLLKCNDMEKKVSIQEYLI